MATISKLNETSAVGQGPGDAPSCLRRVALGAGTRIPTPDAVAVACARTTRS